MATLSLFRTCTRDSSRVTRNHYTYTSRVITIRTYTDIRVYAGDGLRPRLVLKIRILLQIRPSNFGKC